MTLDSVNLFRQRAIQSEVEVSMVVNAGPESKWTKVENLPEYGVKKKKKKSNKKKIRDE